MGMPGGPRTYRFTNVLLLGEACMRGTPYSGMLNVEFEHWAANDAHEGARKAPGVKNTAFLTHDPKLQVIVLAR